MVEPAIGEIRIVSFDFAPRGWALCNGQILQISQNVPLYALLGTMYGGDGKTTFALPDMRGRAPVHVGGAPGNPVGTTFGQESVTLSVSQLPMHNHLIRASEYLSDSDRAAGNLWAVTTNVQHPLYSPMYNSMMSPQCLSTTGGSQPHENRQPFIVFNYIIALTGIFPSRS